MMIDNQNHVVAFCRAGYETDTATELTDRATDLHIYGYPSFAKGDGLVVFICQDANSAVRLVRSLSIASTIFIRQLIWCVTRLDPLPRSDRVGAFISEFQTSLESTQSALGKPIILGNVSVDFPDTESGKEAAKFSKKVVVPLRQQLRKMKLITQKPTDKGDWLHVILSGFDYALIGISFEATRNPHHNGIHRLKFPPEAPSRSTLKLEEAIKDLMTDSQREVVFREGARAVDLGACPGGWTYQLVSRGVHVEAVDNGKMAESLMRTGLVTYAPADGFKYRPDYVPVDLVVCDMIEKPDRVAKLLTEWLVKGWARAAIFNLKLPMKRRYETVKEILSMVDRIHSAQVNNDYQVRCRHLYHDRDEVTVSVLPR